MATSQIRQQTPNVALVPLREAALASAFGVCHRLNYARVDDVNLLGRVFADGLRHSAAFVNPLTVLIARWRLLQ